jgi:putative SOS response-associated peptidase YedK
VCGRYALYPDATVLAGEFNLHLPQPLRPRYNLPPGAFHPVIRQPAGAARRLDVARWGLLPSWVKDPRALAQPINAKSETAADKPMFRHALRRARVLVPASGWYEWRTEQGLKQPYFFARADGQTLAFAGLLERWSGPDGEVQTYAILTTSANALAAPIHARMPVILAPEDYSQWLDPALTQTAPLQALLVPAPAGLLTCWPVSRRVNRPVEDDPSLLERLG